MVVPNNGKANKLGQRWCRRKGKETNAWVVWAPSVQYWKKDEKQVRRQWKTKERHKKETVAQAVEKQTKRQKRNICAGIGKPKKETKKETSAQAVGNQIKKQKKKQVRRQWKNKKRNKIRNKCAGSGKPKTKQK
jgi:hypothetical protein